MRKVTRVLVGLINIFFFVNGMLFGYSIRKNAEYEHAKARHAREVQDLIRRK